MNKKIKKILDDITNKNDILQLKDVLQYTSNCIDLIRAKIELRKLETMDIKL